MSEVLRNVLIEYVLERENAKTKYYFEGLACANSFSMLNEQL